MDLKVRIRSRRFPHKKEQPPFLSSAATTHLPEEEEKATSEEKEEEEEMKEEQPLSPAARLFIQRSFNCHIISIIGLGRPFDIAAVRSGLELTLARHPRFSSILDESESRTPKWIRTKVSIDDHLVIPSFEEGAEFPADFVERYAGNLIGIPLDKSKPLWEIHLLNVKTKDAEATAVLRIHHSLGDGISLMSLFLACTRKASDPGSLPTVPEVKTRDSVRKPGFISFLARLWLFLQVMCYSLVDILLFIATLWFYKDSKSPVKSSKGVESRLKCIVHKTLSLDDMKLVKNAVSGTINDVMLGIVSAGLVRYLSRRYAQKNGVDDEKSSIPSNIRIRSTVLFNTRPTPGLHELAEMMKGNDKVRWGNQVGYAIIPFSMKRHEDPLEYIREAKAIAKRKKLSFEALFTYFSGVLIARLFGFKIASALCHRVLANTTFSFSNIVGPVEDVEFFGHPINYIAPTVYGHPHALTIHFQSYVNKVKLVASVDEETVPDPHQLCTDIAECLALIKDSINKKTGDKTKELSTQ